MTLEEAYELRRKENLSQRHEIERLKKALAEQGSYVNPEKAGLLKQIRHLTWELKRVERDRDRFLEHCRRLMKENAFTGIDKGIAEVDNEQLRRENEQLRNENRVLKETIEHLSGMSSQEHDTAAQIKSLTNEVIRLRSLLNTDSTNSSLPPSKTPAGKKKPIPNSRVKTGRKRGGQCGHVKHTLPSFRDDEVTETVEHTRDHCPCCGAGLEECGCRIKDETDYEVRLVKKRHVFKEYICPDCGKSVRTPIPNHLKEQNQYGPELQAFLLSLTNLGFISMNRTQRLTAGFLQQNASPSEGYIAKLQKRYADLLADFVRDVRNECLKSSVLYWDDTVVFISTQRGCLRFYGNEHLALYKAHAHKNRKSVDDDEVLGLLGKNTVVMHDHNTLNYNDDFCFQNIECIQHFLRDLQKLIEISGHRWVADLKQLITQAIHARKTFISEHLSSVPDEFVSSFFEKLDELLSFAEKEYEKEKNAYFSQDEKRLINRIHKYRQFYFRWVEDLNVPTTNNLSERSLRFIKSREKISGQFISVATASYFANIRTYIETCARNGVNEFDALRRLTSGNPYSVKELLS